MTPKVPSAKTKAEAGESIGAKDGGAKGALDEDERQRCRCPVPSSMTAGSAVKVCQVKVRRISEPVNTRRRSLGGSCATSSGMKKGRERSETHRNEISGICATRYELEVIK